jgi:hypothetical protein
MDSPPPHPSASHTSRLTRRAALSGAGAVVVGAAIGARPAGAQTPPPPFDIRSRVPGSQNDDRATQCIYDDINRMVILMGDIGFRTLFRSRLRTLHPRITPRVAVAAEFGLLEDPARTVELMNRLVEQAPNATLGVFFYRSRRQFPAATIQTLVAIRREGIRLTLPVSDGSLNGARRRALDNLIRLAPNMTFQDLYDLTHAQVGPRTVVAIRRLKRLQLLGWGANDRCCDSGGGPAPSPSVRFDACTANTGSWCNISSTPGYCAAGSDTCPGDRPRRPG